MKTQGKNFPLANYKAHLVRQEDYVDVGIQVHKQKRRRYLIFISRKKVFYLQFVDERERKESASYHEKEDKTAVLPF